MNKYHEGKIYKLSGGGLIYYGSTTKSLWQRYNEHKNCARKELITSHKIFEYDDIKMELVENVRCNSQKELENVEKKYIKENNCINKRFNNTRKKQNIKKYTSNKLAELVEYFNLKNTTTKKELTRYIYKNNLYDEENCGRLYDNIIESINILEGLMKCLGIKKFRKRTKKYDNKEYYQIYLLMITIIKSLFGSDIVKKYKYGKQQLYYFYYINIYIGTNCEFN